MKRILIATLFAFFALAAAAPAGPGDSEPMGTLPYSLIHCPTTASHTASTIDVWVHCHNMPEGYTLTLTLNQHSCTIKTHTVNKPWPTTYPGTWDDYNQVSISSWGFVAGDVLYWNASVVDTKSVHHDSSGTTTMQ